MLQIQKGPVLSIIVFGTIPRLIPTETAPEFNSRTATNGERYEALMSSRDEMTICISQENSEPHLIICRLLQQPMFSPGQLVLVWREKGGWKGTSLLSQIYDKNEFVHYTAGDPRPFSVTQIKHLSTKDSEMFATNLNRIMKHHRLRDGMLKKAQ
jgi:hypothetical protein